MPYYLRRTKFMLSRLSVQQERATCTMTWRRHIIWSSIIILITHHKVIFKIDSYWWNRLCTTKHWNQLSCDPSPKDLLQKNRTLYFETSAYTRSAKILPLVEERIRYIGLLSSLDWSFGRNSISWPFKSMY